MQDVCHPRKALRPIVVATLAVQQKFMDNFIALAIHTHEGLIIALAVPRWESEAASKF